MDEPFGALDPITREQLQSEFLELEAEIRNTIIFVTHDVFEAVKMGDRIALLDEGRLQQLATPRQLVEHPANAFVDQFLGQHRFQLSLLTRTVKSIMEEAGHRGPPPAGGRPAKWLSARSSLVEALDLFKTTGRSRVSVYHGKTYLGELGKDDLLRVVPQILGATGGRA
jgi:osmoprotectant transport system ATP-binding protein